MNIPDTARYILYLYNGQGQFLATRVVHAKDPIGEEGFPDVGDPDHGKGECHIEQNHRVGQVLMEAGQSHRALAQVVKTAWKNKKKYTTTGHNLWLYSSLRS